MKTLDINLATALLAKYAEDPNQEPVILTTQDKPLAVLLPVGDADVETISLSLNPKFLALIEQSRKRHEAEGGISSEAMRRRLGLKPAADQKDKSRKAQPKARRR